MKKLKKDDLNLKFHEVIDLIFEGVRRGKAVTQVGLTNKQFFNLCKDVEKGELLENALRSYAFYLVDQAEDALTNEELGDFAKRKAIFDGNMRIAESYNRDRFGKYSKKDVKTDEGSAMADFVKNLQRGNIS